MLEFGKPSSSSLSNFLLHKGIFFRFHRSSDCVRNQYFGYPLDVENSGVGSGVKVDGNATLGENIADHGGLKIAEIAYAKWLLSNGGQGNSMFFFYDFPANVG